MSSMTTGDAANPGQRLFSDEQMVTGHLLSVTVSIGDTSSVLMILRLELTDIC